MTHDVFGKLRYKDRDESWAGSAQLPLFAAVGTRPEPPELTEEQVRRSIEEMNAAIEGMRETMRERIEKAFADIDRATEEQLRLADTEGDAPAPRDEERESRRAERRARNAGLLAKGRFPIRVAGPDEDEPSAKQVAAYHFLRENERAVYDAVVAQVFDSFQNAYGQEHWRRMNNLQPAGTAAELKDRFALTRLDISREARGGFAHLVFHLDCDWQDEHGLMVVFSPDTHEATWTSWDGLYDLLESDDPEDAGDGGEEFVPTPHDELLEAILTGDEAKARELVAAGADINALGADEYPPLWIAVDQMEVEEVRRLLAFGADPALTNPDEKTTPLKHAKKMYRDMGFAPSKKKDAILGDLMSIMREAAGKQFDELKGRLEEIIKLLEGAGSKG